MFPWVLSALGLAIAVYELWTRPSAEEIAAAAAGGQRFDAGNAARFGGALGGGGGMPSGFPLRLNQKVADQCGLMSNDFADAERWSRGYLGPALALRERLTLMRSHVAPPLWPRSAQRVWCYLQGT